MWNNHKASANQNKGKRKVKLKPEPLYGFSSHCSLTTKLQPLVATLVYTVYRHIASNGQQSRRQLARLYYIVGWLHCFCTNMLLTALKAAKTTRQVNGMALYQMRDVWGSLTATQMLLCIAHPGMPLQSFHIFTVV